MAASGKPADAKSKLEALLSEEKKLGFLADQFETRLALAEIAVRSGHTTIRTQLQALQEQASGRGLNLIARKANTMRSLAPSEKT